MGAVLALVVGAGLVAAQSPSITNTAGPSMMTAASTLKLAKSYSGSSFFDGFNFETADDPTGGYVNYVSRSAAEAGALISTQDGVATMRVNSELRASGRGRDSIRLSSKDEFADGVYILDLNHMPVGCGVWPAWWTVVKNGWPVGGEIDIVEGANTLPSPNGAAWNATGMITTPISQRINRNTGSLHTSGNCVVQSNPYMTGAIDKTTCSSRLNGNAGCGAIMGGNTTYGVESFGAQVNTAGGGWYAMWRDMEVSGGVYVYFWPRNAANVPDDVRNPNTATTNVRAWGAPGANLTTSANCNKDFLNHVIVFNMAFCGDYTAATYATSGCPISSSCPTFVMNNPKAFTETYWSINSLRIYNASGTPASGAPGLTTAQIAGIAVGSAAGVILLGLAFWRYKVTKRRRLALADAPSSSDEIDEIKAHSNWAAPDELPPQDGIYVPVAQPPARRESSVNLATAKPRTGRTTLAPGKTARHHLDGETAAGFYHDQGITPNASSAAVNQLPPPVVIDRRLSAVKTTIVPPVAMGNGTPPVLPANPMNLTSPPRKVSTYSRPDRRPSAAPSFNTGTTSANAREGTFPGEKTGGSWVG